MTTSPNPEFAQTRAPSFTHSRLIPAPRAQVFAAFADPAQLARWWGPDGFRTTIHQFEFKPSGLWRLTMHAPDGQNYPDQTCRFNEVLTPERIVLEHVSPPHFVLSISLEEQGAQTRVLWQQQFDDEATYHQVAAIVGPANEQNLSRWAAVLAQ